MVSINRQAFVIVNPQAAGGRGLRLWPRLADDLFQAIGLFEYEFTNASGVATMLATQAVEQGYRFIVAVGGDGTVNEVLNGLFSADGLPLDPEITLGCLPAGSGTDFWKTLGVKDDLRQALQRLRSGAARRCDIARVTFVGHDGRPMTRLYCNVADVGLGGEVVHRAKQLPSWGSGTINYLLASGAAFFSWEPAEVTIAIDGHDWPSEAMVIALVANGKYCGGGMHIAPEAAVDDGLLNVFCVRPLPKWQFVTMLPKLYAGTLGNQPFIRRATGREIIITAKAPLKVTVDGEVPGRVPATFTVLPKAIAIKA